MKRILLTLLIFCVEFSLSIAQAERTAQSGKEPTLTQYYSAKLGFYNPGNGLNNGLILGIDGITQFNKLNFFLSGDIDFYQKKSIDIFSEPKPDISDQAIILLPIHINFGYQLADIPDAGTKIYAGAGLGYSLYFYSVNYSASSGGLFPVSQNYSDSKNGGSFIFTLFGRILIGKIFVEPRFYFAGARNDNTNGYKFTVNPSGFLITLGFQYGK